MNEDNFNEILLDIEKFSAAILNFKSFPYQIPFLKDKNKRISVRSGRQIGKSTITAIKSTYRAFTIPNEQILILSPSQRQSSLLFTKIANFAKSSLISSFVEKQTMTNITFLNGSQIYVVPAGFQGTSIRGFSPTLIIMDEAAFVDDRVFTALMPSLSATGGDFIMLSTTFGKRGYFYESFFDESYSKYHIKSEENPLITKEFLAHQRSIMTENDYLQEYEGEFIDESGCYFPRELILSCIYDAPLLITVEPDKKYFLGVDCARFGNDETVYVIGESDGKLMKIIEIIRTKQMPITDIIGRVRTLHAKYKFDTVFIDETGLGGGATDVLKEFNIPLRNTKGEKEGITFTLSNKQEMYKNLKYLMENRLIKFPDDKILILQMSSLVYQYTASRNLSIHHPDRPNAHDDIPDALALCALGLKVMTPPLVCFFPSLTDNKVNMPNKNLPIKIC
jgi:phage FluMu gp28-like protein